MNINTKEDALTILEGFSMQLYEYELKKQQIPQRHIGFINGIKYVFKSMGLIEEEDWKRLNKNLKKELFGDQNYKLKYMQASNKETRKIDLQYDYESIDEFEKEIDIPTYIRARKNK
ncbi:MAG: hypothetical protein H8E98_05700 [Bacteroidetes bacterium]|nr:hypothetical protein [Bacteroidota bacterium]